MKKRLLTFVCALCVVFTFPGLVYAKSDTDELTDTDTIKMYTADLEANEELVVEIPISSDPDVLDTEGYCPPDQISPNIIIDDDSRIRVPDIFMQFKPASCVGVVYAEFDNADDKFGTGTLFGPNDVVTAAHVLVDDNGNLADAVYFYLAVNGDIEMHTRYTARNIQVPDAFIDNRNTANDWGIFELSNNVGNYSGYLGWTTNCSVGEHVQIYGYPDDKPDYEMWFAGDYITAVGSSTINYNVDTVAGESGAAVINSQDASNQQIVAIHRGGQTSSNIGKKVDSALASVLSNLRNN